MLFVFLVLCSIVGNALPKPPQQPVTAQPSPVATHYVTSVKKSVPKPTVILTSAPKPIPTSALSTTHGRPVLGSPLSDFVGVYGQPTVTNSSIAPDFYSFHQNSIDVLDVMAYKEDNHFASIILYNNTNGNGWDSLEAAKVACKLYIPDDAVYKRTIDITKPNAATEPVYVSSSLATVFKASRFTDENSNADTPGTFGIVYQYADSTQQQVISCSLQTDLQGN
jgi:hypothetical protein